MTRGMQQAPRIMFVAPFGLYHKGTVRFRVLPMALALQDLGAQVRILVPQGMPWMPPMQEELSERVDVVFLPSFAPLPSRGWWHMLTSSYASLSAAYRFLRSWSPDVVHLVKPIGLPEGVLFLSRFMRLLHGGKGGLKVPLVLDCDDWEAAWFRSQGALAFRFVRWAEQWAWRSADRVTVASHFLLARVSGARRGKGVHYVPNVFLSSGEATRPQRSRRLLVPTRLLDISADVLARWLKIILARVPNMNVLVVGPRGTRLSQMHEALRSLGIEGRVAVLRWQEREVFVRLMQHTRVGLYAVEDTPATRAKCPVRVVQMMAYGIPVVAVDVGEPRYLLGDAGLLTSPDGAALAETLAEIWFRGEELERLGRRARERAVREFSMSRMGERLWAVYELLGRAL